MLFFNQSRFRFDEGDLLLVKGFDEGDFLFEGMIGTMLTEQQYDHLLAILTLILEAKSNPAENTTVRLRERSELPEETVAWCMDVLWLHGKGWVDFHEHPRTLEQAFYANKRFQSTKEDLDDLHARWQRTQPKVHNLPAFDKDDEDPDDEWVEGVYED